MAEFHIMFDELHDQLPGWVTDWRSSPQWRQVAAAAELALNDFTAVASVHWDAQTAAFFHLLDRPLPPTLERNDYLASSICCVVFVSGFRCLASEFVIQRCSVRNRGEDKR